MQSRKTQLSQKVVSTNSNNASSTVSQHGSLLLRIPPENLAHITSNLEPRSLLSLAKVCVSLNRHVNDEHTWHLAFLQHYFAIGIEADLYGAKYLLLRRFAGTWRQEFILYYSLLRRWERSRNATTAHIPHHSAVSGIHLMPSHGLLASSLRYGIVSRSLPSTGRVLRGFLDASGTGTGLGIGNPNTEFTPNVSSVAMGSDGGTAKIAWGFRNGDVAFTSANKAMDAGSRSAAKFSRCSVGDEHNGVVLDVIWDGGAVLSASADGRIKIWDPKRARCVWTSSASVEPDAFDKVVSILSKGIVVAVRRSGTIVIWHGFEGDVLESLSSPTSTLSIPSSVEDPVQHPISSVHIDYNSATPTLLASFTDSLFLYRLDVDLATGVVETTKFGDAAVGCVTSVAPYFANKDGESSLVVAGTQLGCVAIFGWDVLSSPLPTHKLEAYEDASTVTAVAWNGLVLVTGSAAGVTKVFHGITMGHLRTFASPIPRSRAVPAFAGGPLAVDPAVRQILLGAERETMFVAVGDHVLAWRAGPVPKGGFRASAKNSAGKKKERGDISSKALQYLEMRQQIAESKHLLKEEGRFTQRAYGREREQQARLNSLGLDEVEAVEYVLMLSREEAIERDRTASSSRAFEEAIFEADCEMETGTTFAPSSGSSASSSPPHTNSSPIARNGRPIPRASTSPGNDTYSNTSTKIQVSPPFRAEATEASFSPPATSPVSPTPPSRSFPPISSSVSPPRATQKSAWSTPLTRSPVASPNTSRASPPSSVPKTPTKARKEDDEDDDLQLAIALSLSQMQMK
ncbi:hypothetical protein MKEN_00710800 [Mycena kentingensis (nom. inval.)]|nr:hypothetical protein MKEN_00710800 [Mycena kentingensis (nom. inval.)]